MANKQAKQTIGLRTIVRAEFAAKVAANKAKAPSQMASVFAACQNGSK